MSVHSHSAGPHAGRSPARPAAATPEFPRHVVTAVLVSHDGARWLPDGARRAARPGAPRAERRRRRHRQRGRLRPAARRRPRRRARPAPRPPHRLRPGRRRGRPHRRRAHPRRPALPQAPQRLGPRHAAAGATTPTTCRSCRTASPSSGCGCCTTTARPSRTRSPNCCASSRTSASSATRSPSSAPSCAAGTTAGSSSKSASPSPTRGRRWTGLDRREQDQGQHDQVRPVLSVSTAGMLIRRDVFEELGGFDRRLPLMRDDVDLCWRAQAAGPPRPRRPRRRRPARRGRLPRAPHRRLRGPHRRASPHRVDKAGAVYTLLVNARGALLPWVLLRLVIGTLAAHARLPGRQGPRPGARRDRRALRHPAAARSGSSPARRRRGQPAVDTERTAAALPAARRHRARHRRAGRRQPLRPLRRRTGHAAGRHGGAVESGPGGDDADFLEIEQFARLKRIARKPGPVLFVVLLFVSLRRLPRPARRRGARGRRAAARPRRRLRPVVRATSTAGTRSAPAAPSPRRPTWRSSPLVVHRSCSARTGLAVTAAAGLLRAAGRLHRLLRLPPAGRVPPAARLGVRRVRLPARRHRRAGRRPPRHRRAGDPAAADRARGRRRERPRALRGSARQLARHLGVRPAADPHHGVHPDRLADRAASSAVALLARRAAATLAAPTGCASSPRSAPRCWSSPPWSLSLLRRSASSGRPA